MTANDAADKITELAKARGLTFPSAVEQETFGSNVLDLLAEYIESQQ